MSRIAPQGGMARSRAGRCDLPQRPTACGHLPSIGPLSKVAQLCPHRALRQRPRSCRGIADAEWHDKATIQVCADEISHLSAPSSSIEFRAGPRRSLQSIYVCPTSHGLPSFVQPIPARDVCAAPDSSTNAPDHLSAAVGIPLAGRTPSVGS